MKKCSNCHIEKEITEFHKNKTYKDGLQSQCKKCVKEHHKEWYQNNKKSVIEHNIRYRKRLLEKITNIKKQSGCILCDEKEVCCLDFHHVEEDDKLDDIGNLIHRGWGWNLIIAEINKCICVCSNCHRKIHSGIIKYRREANE